jgi:hypothetical protein
MNQDDWVIVMGATEDGGGVEVARVRQQRVEMGQVRPLRAGQPIYGEVVKLTPMPDLPAVCAVEIHCAAPTPAADEGARNGPVMVNSHAYRDSWERIWGPQTLENKPN